ncbi:MAG TPA: extensin family protein [Polyangiaceae bacterium]|nr:extensin family protein [Polyangiaceae bacterium]
MVTAVSCLLASATAATADEPSKLQSSAALPAPTATPQAPNASARDASVTANVDPSDDAVVAPPEALPDCAARLERRGVRFEPAALPLVQKHGFVCGAPQAVKYLRGPEGISFSPRPVTTCQLALGLARFESLAQTLALRYFGVRIKSIRQGGTYNCRPMARFRLVSEHSYGNAIDLYEFTLENGKRINVLRHFGKPGEQPSGKEGRFLRELAQAAFDEGAFSVVVTRFFDELHRDHIHVDMAHYRTDGSR